MIQIKISKELKQSCPDITLGCIQANVYVQPSCKELEMRIDNTANKLRTEMSLEEISALANIKESREAYKRLGKDPSRYRLSSEALIRRILQGKKVYRINNIVDINNLVSIISFHSVGSYDVDKIKPPVIFASGQAGGAYKGIGKDFINIENLPVFSDSQGNFGSPTSDSERTMITNESSNIVMNIISFSGKEDLDQYLNYAQQLLEKYADGKNFASQIVE